MDVDLTDVITIGIETKSHLNYPQPSIAASPSVSFVPRPPLPLATATSPTSTALTFTFAPDFSFDLSVRSLVGALSRLQDIPTIAQLVESQVQLWFVERCVQPRYQRVVLPNFWPSRANEGNGAMDDDGKEDDDVAVEDDERM
jgi:maintenance of mitochondrial morphology protein 1